MRNAQFARKAGGKSVSLFERMRAEDQDIDDYGSSDEVAVRIRSIKRNLANLLNARAGGAASAPKYGLDDINDANVGSADMLRKVATQISTAIKTYEPRIENVQVRFERHENTDTELLFHISAQTRIEHRDEQLVIDVVLLGSGFEIR